LLGKVRFDAVVTFAKAVVGLGQSRQHLVRIKWRTQWLKEEGLDWSRDVCKQGRGCKEKNVQVLAKGEDEKKMYRQGLTEERSKAGTNRLGRVMKQ